MYSVTDPATGELIEELPNATDEEVQAGIERVHRGYSHWRRRPVTERGHDQSRGCAGAALVRCARLGQVGLVGTDRRGLGAPDLLLGMFVLGDAQPSEIATLGRALSEGAAQITRQGGGVNPWSGALGQRGSGLAG